MNEKSSSLKYYTAPTAVLSVDRKGEFNSRINVYMKIIVADDRIRRDELASWISIKCDETGDKAKSIAAFEWKNEILP
jgi:hypothetical protein